MNKDGNRVILISISVVCFILLYSTAAFYVMEEGEKAKRHVVEKSLGEITLVKQELETKLKDAETLTVELKTRLKAQEDTIAQTIEQLNVEKTANSKNLLKLRSRENEIRAMKAKLESEKALKDALSASLAKANEDYLAIKAETYSASKTKEEEDNKAKEKAAREGMSLGTIVVKQTGR
ncbi:MAG: hypothetical protein Q7S07_02115 [Candidatus Omnitrophota bacterium]|nr:hypothetical protein [Candidatus Omnitrophota bacterium]